MNILIKFSAILFLSIASSCDSAKTAATEKETETKTTKSMDSKLVAEGFIAGTVKYQADSKCTYVIVDEKTNLKYDPINIDDVKFIVFKKDADKVYFKFRLLRMMNRCEDAQPIELENIKKRED